MLIWCIQALIIRAGICFLIGFCFVEDHMHSHVGRMEDDWAGDMGDRDVVSSRHDRRLPLDLLHMASKHLCLSGSF